MFNVNFLYIISWFIPESWRDNRHVDWLLTNMGGHRYIYARLMEMRERQLVEVTHPPQVIYLEKLLNELWESPGPLIEIVDSTHTTDIPYAWHLKDEGRPDDYVYRISETSDPVYVESLRETRLYVDFIVNIPDESGIPSDDDINNLLTKYVNPTVTWELNHL